jgi:hypothetical protein
MKWLDKQRIVILISLRERSRLKTENASIILAAVIAKKLGS